MKIQEGGLVNPETLYGVSGHYLRNIRINDVAKQMSDLLTWGVRSGSELS